MALFIILMVVIIINDVEREVLFLDTALFIDLLNKNNINFFTGVPDSLLKPLCDYLTKTYGIDSGHHLIAHNEGGCVAFASGYHLATGKVPCVYMQNSGIGNMTNPVVSLTHPKVYAIPILYVIGWRGEPGVKDEPQHVFQGEIMLRQLESMEIETFVVDKHTTEQELYEKLNHYKMLFELGKSAAFIVRKGAFIADYSKEYKNRYILNRETVIKIITEYSCDDMIVSTTGKISRELYEIRANSGGNHSRDFLTVGSMGHSAMIALGIAVNKKKSRVWCIDGDGALLMHMGALSVVGNIKPENFIHVILNNESHETVGGMPTVISTTDVCAMAIALGYKTAYSVDNETELTKVLEKVKTDNGPALIEVKVALGARADLGRPILKAVDNKSNFMKFLGEQK